ncbi:MAG: DUF3999 domain-containing protein [Rudaea sp.]
MMLRFVFALGLALTTASVYAADSDEYAYAWPLHTQGDSAAWQVELTPEVYAAVTRADLRDIAVLNAAGDPVPMAARVDAAATSRETLSPLPVFALPVDAATGDGDETIRLRIERGADGRLRSLDTQLAGPTPVPPAGDAIRAPAATVDAGRAHALLVDASALREPITSLVLDWTNVDANVSAQFAIEGSDDLQHWHTIADNATVLRLAQSDNVIERHDIALRGARAPYLRLRRLDDGVALRELRVSARMQALSSPERAARVWTDATPDGGDDRQLSGASPLAARTHGLAWRYHLPAPLAIEALRLTLADDNSLARIVVLNRVREPYDAAASWMSRGSFVAFRLRQGDSAVDNGEFDLTSAPRIRELRVESSTPLAHAPALSVAWRQDRFVFLTQGGGPYRLVAGSARTLRGDYPLDTALAHLRTRLGNDWQPPLAALGARAELGGERALTPAAAPSPIRDWRTWLLWLVLVGAAALIGGMALSLLRKPNE